MHARNKRRRAHHVPAVCVPPQIRLVAAEPHGKARAAAGAQARPALTATHLGDLERAPGTPQHGNRSKAAVRVDLAAHTGIAPRARSGTTASFKPSKFWAQFKLGTPFLHATISKPLAPPTPPPLKAPSAREIRSARTRTPQRTRGSPIPKDEPPQRHLPPSPHTISSG